MKYLQIEISDAQHRKLKALCASRNITIKSWLQNTFAMALSGAEQGFAPPKKRLYIAYGSNLNLRQMRYRCPTAIPLATATLPGYDLLFRGGNGNAVAAIEPGVDNVPVRIWKLESGDELALDRYEGFPRFYRKENIDVEVNGKIVKAMVYVMNDGHPLGAPSQSYLNTILEGYKSAGFDTDVLQRALERSLPEQAEDLEPAWQSDLEWW